MRRKIAYSLVGAFWAVAVCLLVNREIAPALALKSREKATFEGYMKRLELPYEEKMGIYVLDKRIGELVTTIERQPGDWISVETNANTGGGGGISELFSFHLQSQALFDDRYQLTSVTMRANALGMRVRMQGFVQNSVLNLRIKTDGDTIEKSFPVDPNTLIADSFFPFAGAPELRVGAEWSTAVINPIAMVLDQAHVTVVEQVEEIVNGQKQKVYVLETEFAGQRSKSWVTASGVLLRQESPLGIKLVREG